MRGPVWVTTKRLLEEFCAVPIADVASDEQIKVTKGMASGQLNLGWLLFSDVAELDAVALSEKFAEVSPRLVVVDQSIFPQIVNSNLEVRTSVSISPETGAAEAGALFTYEAIPRDTYLVHEVVEDCFWKAGAFCLRRSTSPIPRRTSVETELAGEEQKGAGLKGWNTPLDIALAGLGLIDPLGVGEWVRADRAHEHCRHNGR